MNKQTFDCSEELAFIFSELSGDSSKAQIPLSIWKSKLIEQGLQCEVLIGFFCSESLLEHWRNPKSIKEVYLDAISADVSTAVFIEKIIKEENDYAEQAAAAIDSLVEERESLMSTAGGNMKHPIIGGVGIGAVLALGIGIAIWKRDTVGSWFKKKVFNREVAQIENEAEQQLDQDPIARANELLIDRIDSRDANGTFIANELASLAHNSGLNLEETSTQVRRKVERDEDKITENPQAFLEDAIKKDPANFQLNLKGFWTDRGEIRDAGIQEAEEHYTTSVDQVISHWMEHSIKYYVERENGQGFYRPLVDEKIRKDLEEQLWNTVLENTRKDGEKVVSKQFQALENDRAMGEVKVLIDDEMKQLAKITDPEFLNITLKRGITDEEVNSTIKSHQEEIERLMGSHKEYEDKFNELYAELRLYDRIELTKAIESDSKLGYAFDWYMHIKQTKIDIKAYKSEYKEIVESDRKFDLWKTIKLSDIKEYYGEELAAAAEKKFHLNVQERIEREFRERAEKALEVDFDNAVEIETENIEQLIEPDIESEVDSLIEEEVKNVEKTGDNAVQILDDYL